MRHGQGEQAQVVAHERHVCGLDRDVGALAPMAMPMPATARP